MLVVNFGVRSLLKNLVTRPAARFNKLCRANDLRLDYGPNADGLPVLDAIFRGREYADHFPFYQAATVVDIGAHYGYFSLFAAANLAPRSTVYAIEPAAANVKVLKRNLRDSGAGRVHPHQLAIAGRSGKATLHIGRGENNSLLPDYRLLPDNSLVSEVNALSLEDFMTDHNIEFIDFLKLDCEGAEYDILFNASTEVLRRITTISLEFHDLKSTTANGGALVKHLRETGFRIVKFTHEPTSQNLNYGKIVGTRE